MKWPGRKWSFVILGAALLVAAHAVWDYIEASRLKSYVDAVRASGAPITSFDADPHYPDQWPDPERNAAPFYAAAAMLAAGGAVPDRPVANYLAPGRIEQTFFEELASGTVSPDVLKKVRDLVANTRNVEALRLLDLATSLDFKGFAPGGEPPNWPLLALLRHGGLRTAYLAWSGDAAAAASALAEIRLSGGDGRPLEWESGGLWFAEAWQQPSHARLQLVLDRTTPSEPALAALATALAEADQDDRLARALNSSRALAIEGFLGGNPVGSYGPYGAGSLVAPAVGTGRSWSGVFNRPLRAHMLSGELDAFDQLMRASREGWPNRLNIAKQIQEDIKSRIRGAIFNEIRIDLFGTSTARVRSARAAVAIERYKRRHVGKLPESLADLVPMYLPAVPIDPFSGQPLLYRKTAPGYAVYSVGPNRQDDNAAFTGLEPFAKATRSGDGPLDVGVRITKK